MQHISRKGKEEKRKWILSNATELIFEHGFDAVSMDQIAQKAEISKGSLYTYFKSKVDLYLSIGMEGERILHQQMSNTFSTQINGLEILQSMSQVFVEFVNNHPGYFDAMLYFDNQSNFHQIKDADLLDACMDQGQVTLNFIMRAIQIGQQDGSIRASVNPRSIAIQIWAFTNGINELLFKKNEFESQFFKSINGEDYNLQRCMHDFMVTLSYAIASDSKHIEAMASDHQHSQSLSSKQPNNNH